MNVNFLEVVNFGVDHKGEKITYREEISQMMFGFGDNPTPNPATVELVENIVLKQLRSIVTEALKYSNDGKSLLGQHLVFLMRHNKHKMRRFVQYLHNRSIVSKLNRQGDVAMKPDFDEKHNSPLLNFIKYIDETGELTDMTEIDDIKWERQIRADRISVALDEKKYLEFCKARAASFKSRYQRTDTRLAKLGVWVDPSNKIDFSADAMDVMCYYAYETVAELVDYALLVRMDTKSGKDPLQHLQGSYYTATMFNGSHRVENDSNFDFTKDYLNQPPISVHEIEEVMRRIYTPQAGVLNFGGKIPETHYLLAI